MANTKISALTAKDTPIAADTGVIVDSVGGANKSVLLGNLPLTGNRELKALATGILKNTTATGTPSIAVAGTDFFPVRAVTNVASSATPTPAVGTAGADIFYNLTALAEAAVFGAPTGTPVAGQRLIITILDNGTARALDFTNAAYRAIGVIKPTTTAISKYLKVALIYDGTDTKWHMVGVSQEA